MGKLSSSDITVVIQGQIHKDMKKVLKSIKHFLPSAEIILSTWKNSDTEGLEELFDKLVLNEDCGGVIFETEENRLNNLNRILISSQNGIKEATRKYVLRIRSDLYLKNDNILKLTDCLPKRIEEKSLFKNRIFAYDIFSIKYDIIKNKKQRMLFHISDWLYFGLKEDLEQLFDIPLVQEPEFSKYFENIQKPCEDIHKFRLWKMSPEQYITSTNAKKVFENLNYENYLDNSDENIEISQDFIINNFVIFSPNQMGIKTLKKEYKDIKMFTNNPIDYYSKLEQKKDYQKYCDKNYKIPNDWTIKLYNIKYFEKLRKHFYMLILGSIWRKPSQMASCLYYLVQSIIAIVKGALCQKK